MESSGTAVTSVILFLLFLVFAGASFYEIKRLNRRGRSLVRTRCRRGRVVPLRRRVRVCLFLLAMIASGLASFFTAFYSPSDNGKLSVERANGIAESTSSKYAAGDRENEEGSFFFTPVSIVSGEQADEAEPVIVRVAYVPYIQTRVSEFEENKEL